jgi:hypothetical protein
MPVDEWEKQMTEQLHHLAKQTFLDWNLVNFIDGFPNVSKKVGKKTVLVNASVYEGLNLQRAATKYCGPASVLFLLDHNETLTSEKDLETIANHFRPIGVFSAFVNLKIDERTVSPSSAARGKAQRVSNKPNKELLGDIANLMRAFTVEAYRFISHIDLRHSLTGRYFDREIALLSVLEVGENFAPCDSGGIVYQVRRL